LKKIQKILEVHPDSATDSPQFRELAEHTEGLIETITLQMAQVFDRPDSIVDPANYRLSKHLIQTLNSFCDHAILAESLTVEILTSVLEELTLRLLQTDESPDAKVKDLSRFINMIILRIFATCRRISVFRALFNLLLQIMKPFPMEGTTDKSRDARVAELVLKCIWKLARSIPSDLEKVVLNPIELFSALESFLQSIPPNEWRARAANKIPGGDMPLRTIKVIIQHVVVHFADEVYDHLSAAFDDPSATIVYPYVYRILNSNATRSTDSHHPRSATNGSIASASAEHTRPSSPDSRAFSPPPQSASAASSRYLDDHRVSGSQTSRSHSSHGGASPKAPPTTEPDPDARLIEIIGHISSEKTGALHKEGITELHHFLKEFPHKKPKVDKMLDDTGPQFRKYISRALASRALEDEERGMTTPSDVIPRIESIRQDSAPSSPHRTSPRRSIGSIDGITEDPALTRLHGIFNYQGPRASVMAHHSTHSYSSVGSQPASTSDALMAQLAALRENGR
jgi:cytoskeleton-associated protein 5